MPYPGFKSRYCHTILVHKGKIMREKISLLIITNAFVKIQNNITGSQKILLSEFWFKTK